MYEIGKIKVSQRDFHGALFVMEKGEQLCSEQKELLRLKTFCEGVVALMKENFEEGLEILNRLMKQLGITRFLACLFYSFRAYAEMQLGRLEDARMDYLRIEKEEPLTASNLYNKYICEGILSWGQHKCEQALAYFTKASKVSPHNLEPFYYKAVTLVQFVNQVLPHHSPTKINEYMFNALKIVKREGSPSSKHADLLLIKALLEFNARDIKNAIHDIDRVLDEPNSSPVAPYIKGLILGEREEYYEAIEYFS